MSETWTHGVVLGPYRDRSLREALGEVARAFPERVAIVDDARALTYEAVLREIDGVASAVSTASDEAAPVTVVVEHGIEAVVAVLGVITAGRIAVPVDARDPLERLAAIHADAASSLVVTHRRGLATARALAAGLPVLVVEDAADAPPRQRAPDGAAPALVLFTSGSTGTPKGVTISIESTIKNALRVAHVHGLTPEDRMAVPGSLAFGASYTRIFAALLSGARVCLYDLRERGPAEIPAWVNANGVTVMLFIPSVLRAVLDHQPHGRMPTVRLVTFGGEALYGRDARSARRLFGSDTVFRNRLSSTEVHGMAGRLVTAADDQLDGVIPVGALEPWLDARIVDDDDRDVADGEPGRLVVIGPDFALGYWNDPELTAEKFWDLPDGRRAFRTSDLVRRLDDGALLHVGRADDRVKVRGALVSPMEVERALADLDGVATAAVTSVLDADGGRNLVAYVVPERGVSPTPSSIRRELAALVPPPMVPATVVMLDELPIGARGKLDRDALPPPTIASAPYRAPVGREQDLADIFRAVLGVDRVGLDDDFFELGGDSLAAIELLALIDERFGVQLASSALLDAPTVAALAPLLVRRRARGLPTTVRLTEPSAAAPFFCVAGGGSPAITLRSLAEALGDGRATYGIQARGLEDRSFPDRSVERSARRYLEEIRQVQPSGPYFLAGYSFGGVVAYEMACRLEAVGERVALLALLDSTAPGTKPTGAERFAERADALREGPGGRALQWAAGSAAAHARRAVALTTAGIMPRRDLRQYYVFYRVASRQRRRYRPTSVFDGPALVLRASDQDHGELDRDLGWSPYLRSRPSVVDVPGTHHTMIFRPHVTSVGAELQRAFDSAS